MAEVKQNIIGPKPYPEPPQGKETLILLLLAMTYLTFLLLFKGIDSETAFGMVSRKYGISEDTLRKAASKGGLWK